MKQTTQKKLTHSCFFADHSDMMEPEANTPTSLPVSVRFRCSGVLTPGQWHHLALVMAKDLKKSCKLSAYLNGKPVGTAKVRPGGLNAERWR